MTLLFNPFGNGTFNLGVEFSYAVSDDLSKASLEKSQIVVKQQALSLSNLILSSYVQMKSFDENLKYQTALIKSQRKKVKFMQTVFEEEARSYRQGKSSLTDLLNEMNKLRNYRLSALLASIELEQASLIRAANTDRLLDYLDQELK